MPRNCEYCRGPMPATARAHAKYCDGTCRTAASRARKKGEIEIAAESVTPVEIVEVRLPVSAEPVFPASLTRLARWIRRSDKKVPLSVAGGVAQSDDETTWSSFSEAAESTIGAGLGFVLSGDGIICVDLDHVITDGVLSDEAEAFLASLPHTYIEVSPSGDGLHVWGRGLVLTSRKFRNTTMAGEVIGARKYATMTGNRFRNAPLSLANIAGQAAPLIY